MQIKLTTGERLGDLRSEQNLTLDQLSEKTKISKSALSKYENDESADISVRNLAILAQYYGVSLDYLSGLTEIKNAASVPHELCLSDDALDVLRNGKFNHRLLSEMLCHKNFERMMVDAEIFVDRFADEAIKSINEIFKLIQEKLSVLYAPGDNDLYMRTLELSQIVPTEYFRSVVSEDITAILRDIRDAHMEDATTADEEFFPDKIKKRIMEAINTTSTELNVQAETDNETEDEISTTSDNQDVQPGTENGAEKATSAEGDQQAENVCEDIDHWAEKIFHATNQQEKQARVFLGALGIDFDSLTADEFITLINILQKSDLTRIQQLASQRGKANTRHPAYSKGNRKKQKKQKKHK